MRQTAGFLKLHRKIQHWEWYDDPKTLALFIHILAGANWRPTRWHGIELQPGQMACSVEKLSLESGLTTQEVRTALSKLQGTGEITIEATNRFSLVTVANWALYQSEDDGATNKQQTNNNQTTNKQQRYKNKRNKEYKNTPPISPPGDTY